ncbi:unnamed protein product [Amoebophrya sp. A25]|nr:unnamed protein product [Amoebophrya sp. A25]|eukprot:GSA25T00014107001.1
MGKKQQRKGGNKKRIFRSKIFLEDDVSEKEETFLERKLPPNRPTSINSGRMGLGTRRGNGSGGSAQAKKPAVPTQGVLERVVPRPGEAQTVKTMQAKAAAVGKTNGLWKAPAASRAVAKPSCETFTDGSVRVAQLQEYLDKEVENESTENAEGNVTDDSTVKETVKHVYAKVTKQLKDAYKKLRELSEEQNFDALTNSVVDMLVDDMTNSLVKELSNTNLKVRGESVIRQDQEKETMEGFLREAVKDDTYYRGPVRDALLLRVKSVGKDNVQKFWSKVMNDTNRRLGKLVEKPAQQETEYAEDPAILALLDLDDILAGMGKLELFMLDAAAAKSQSADNGIQLQTRLSNNIRKQIADGLQLSSASKEGALDGHGAEQAGGSMKKFVRKEQLKRLRKRAPGKQSALFEQILSTSDIEKELNSLGGLKKAKPIDDEMRFTILRQIKETLLNVATESAKEKHANTEVTEKGKFLKKRAGNKGSYASKTRLSGERRATDDLQVAKKYRTKMMEDLSRTLKDYTKMKYVSQLTTKQIVGAQKTAESLWRKNLQKYCKMKEEENVRKISAAHAAASTHSSRAGRSSSFSSFLASPEDHDSRRSLPDHDSARSSSSSFLTPSASEAAYSAKITEMAGATSTIDSESIDSIVAVDLNFRDSSAMALREGAEFVGATWDSSRSTPQQLDHGWTTLFSYTSSSNSCFFLCVFLAPILFIALLWWLLMRKKSWNKEKRSTEFFGSSEPLSWSECPGEDAIRTSP